MSNKSRSDRIQLLVKVVSKHFTPVLAPSDRNLFEHLVYASVLEDAPYEAADEAFHRLQGSFFDWNEVRVTTVTELIEHLQPLPDPKAAALRVKKNLQSVFESRYNFDLNDLIKLNQGKAIAELEKLAGMSRFVLAYVTQNSLGGHAIPVSNNIQHILLATGIVTEAEVEKGQIPGLDRTVPKSKGPEFSSGLHQLGLLVAQSPRGKQSKTIMQEAGAAEVKKAAAESKDKKSVDKTPAKSRTSTKSPTRSSRDMGSKKAAPKKSPTEKKSGAIKKVGTSKKVVGPKSADKSSRKSPTAKKPPAQKSAPKKLPEKNAVSKRKPR